MKEPPIGRYKPGSLRARFSPEAPPPSRERSREYAPDGEPSYEPRSRDRVANTEPYRERRRERPPYAEPPYRERRRERPPYADEAPHKERRRERPPYAEPPYRERGRRRRAPYMGRQKILITLVVALALVAVLPLGTFLAMKIIQHQQAQIAPTATPVRTPTPSAAQIEAQFINQMIAGMSLDEELGQMLIVSFNGATYDNNNSLQTMIVNEHAGGIILYGGNLETQAQVTALNTAAQSAAKIPLFISTDQEGGLVNRLESITGQRPSARTIGASGDPNKATQQGVSDGQILKQLGINLNLAPVVDVQTLSDAQYDATTMAGFEYREFGTTPDKVATFAGAYLNGLQAQGIIGCLKHWPGLGGVAVDPHEGLPILNRSQTDLNNIDFAPYRTLLAQGHVDMIMDTHEMVTAYDPNLPASLSPIMIDQVLRHDLGYQGVVFTDALDMGALTARYSVAQSAVLAVLAGNDLLEGIWSPDNMQSVLDALNAAVASGKITKARIDLSVQRILALKIKYGLLQVPGIPLQG